MLQVVKFYNKQIKRVGTTDYLSFDATKWAGYEDFRFTLYHYPQKIAHTLMIDIDGLAVNEGDVLFDLVSEVFGEYNRFQLFTGGGHHIYFPLEKPFTYEDLPHYRESYEKKVMSLKQHLPSHAVMDLGVFHVQKYGRLPGTINSKNGGVVKLLYHDDSLPICPSLANILEYNESAVIKQVSFHRETRPDNSTANPYKFCHFVRYCETNQKDLDFELWKSAIIILANAGQKKRGL